MFVNRQTLENDLLIRAPVVRTQILSEDDFYMAARMCQLKQLDELHEILIATYHLLNTIDKLECSVGITCFIE